MKKLLSISFLIGKNYSSCDLLLFFGCCFVLLLNSTELLMREQSPLSRGWPMGRESHQSPATTETTKEN